MFPVLLLPALRPPASQYALTMCHAVFLVLRLPTLLCPALRPPESQYALTLSRSVSRAASPDPSLPCPASACVSLCARPSKAHIEMQATQPTQGRVAQVSVTHTFEYVSSSWKVGLGSKVLRLLSPAPRSVADTVWRRSPQGAEQRRCLWFTTDDCFTVRKCAHVPDGGYESVH